LIYLDHAASTPIADSVLEEMMPYLKENYGNHLKSYGFPKKAHVLPTKTVGNPKKNYSNLWKKYGNPLKNCGFPMEAKILPMKTVGNPMETYGNPWKNYHTGKSKSQYLHD